MLGTVVVIPLRIRISINTLRRTPVVNTPHPTSILLKANIPPTTINMAIINTAPLSRRIHQTLEDMDSPRNNMTHINHHKVTVHLRNTGAQHTPVARLPTTIGVLLHKVIATHHKDNIHHPEVPGVNTRRTSKANISNTRPCNMGVPPGATLIAPIEGLEQH